MPDLVFSRRWERNSSGLGIDPNPRKDAMLFLKMLHQRFFPTTNWGSNTVVQKVRTGGKRRRGDARRRVHKENGVANDLGKGSGSLLNQICGEVVPYRNEIKLFQASGEEGFVCLGLGNGSAASGIGDPAVWKRGVPMEKVLWFPGKVPDLIASND